MLNVKRGEEYEAGGCVTEQTGACAHGALTHDPIITVGRNRFLFTGVKPRRG